MRPLIVYSDVTVDGFMAGPGNDLDFLVDDPQLERELTGRLRSVADTIVFGRGSFAGSAAYWTAADGELADWMNSTRKVILSSDGGFDVSAWANSTVATGVDAVGALKETTGGAIVAFGGVRAVRSLVAAGLADEYWLKINPTVVGRGGSPFADVAERKHLTLRSATTFPSGTIAAISTN